MNVDTFFAGHPIFDKGEVVLYKGHPVTIIRCTVKRVLVRIQTAKEDVPREMYVSPNNLERC